MPENGETSGNQKMVHQKTSTSAGLALATAFFMLTACQPPAAETAKPDERVVPTQTADAADGCNVSAERPWIDQETPVRRYTAHASVIGPTCQQGVTVLIIRQREGTPIYSWTGQTQYIFGLKDAANPAAMKTALKDWIDQRGGGTTDTLPEWETTEGQPKRAEFPFMPEPNVIADKSAWDDLRRQKLDLFCFPQGGESSNCAVLRPGVDGAPTMMEDIGLQLFPG